MLPGVLPDLACSPSDHLATSTALPIKGCSYMRRLKPVWARNYAQKIAIIVKVSMGLDIDYGRDYY
jgi:hypothetical protein